MTMDNMTAPQKFRQNILITPWWLEERREGTEGGKREERNVCVCVCVLKFPSTSCLHSYCGFTLTLYWFH